MTAPISAKHQQFTRPQLLLIAGLATLVIALGGLIAQNYTNARELSEKVQQTLLITLLDANVQREALQLQIKTTRFLHGDQRDLAPLEQQRAFLTNQLRALSAVAAEDPTTTQSVDELFQTLAVYDQLFAQVRERLEENPEHPITDLIAPFDEALVQLERQVKRLYDQAERSASRSLSATMQVQETTHHLLGVTGIMLLLTSGALILSLKRSVSAQFAEAYALLATEIAERRRTEEVLRKSEEHFRLLAENINDLVSQHEPDGSLRYVSPSCQRVLGYSADFLHGHAWEALLHPDEAAWVLHPFSTGVLNVSEEPVVYRLRHQSGAYVWFETISKKIRDAEGNVLALQCVSRDVSERVRVSQELKEFTAKLQQSNRELEQFAYVASHDLQEPLRKIQAFGDRLKLRYGASLDAGGREYIERMQSAAERMQTMINDLLALSRVSTQVQPHTPVDLNEIVRDVVADLEIRIEQTGGRVEIEPLPLLRADPVRMRQLFQNLIGNALKFHRPGAPPVVRIACKQLPCPPGALLAGTSAQMCYQITVADNGIGFEEKYLDRIFLVFQRLHGRSSYPGSGIGLAICRKIVEQHGGTITARSAPDAGATFIVTLPAQCEQQDERAAPVTPAIS